VGVERVGVRFARYTGILLGPETTNRVSGWLVSVEIHAGVRTGSSLRAEAYADKTVWVWCWLRIAQWMRASLKLLWSSF
jgi:hypothetical protein